MGENFKGEFDNLFRGNQIKTFIGTIRAFTFKTRAARKIAMYYMGIRAYRARLDQIPRAEKSDNLSPKQICHMHGARII